MASTNNRTYNLRRRIEVNYADQSDPVSDSHSSELTLSTSPVRSIVTGMVESRVNSIARDGKSRGQGGNSSFTGQVGSALGGSGVNVVVRNSISSRGRGRRGCMRGGRGGGRWGWGGQWDIEWGGYGTRSRRPQRREAEEKRNKETSNIGSSSIVENGLSSSEGQAKNMRKDPPSPVPVRSCTRTIMSLLIDCKLIGEDLTVGYVDSTMRGRITRGGILCDCCQREISVWTFEKHAGSDLGQPYEHIHLLNDWRTCLHYFQITAWNNPEERGRRCPHKYVPKENAAERNNDACSICGDGGALICCDKCPSTYHPSCMDIERVPQRDWLCPYCMCKFCGLGEESKEFITCAQCVKKFHWGCFQKFENEFSIETLNRSCSRIFCGPGCQEIYEKLDNSLRIRNDIFASYSWRVVRQTDVVSASGANLENNLKVALTRMLMDEAFVTIIDKQTGIDVVQSIVYSRTSNLRRIDFIRFYTFVLEKDDAVIAAASIRFHGGGMAEMPFIATDKVYRGQGICRMLMREIESFLRSLQVKTLVIPSTPETVEMWKQKFNFNVASRAMKREISSYNILMFPQATRLCKDLSARITDVIHDNADNNRNEVPQTVAHQERPREPAGRPLLDLNLEPLPEDC